MKQAMRNKDELAFVWFCLRLGAFRCFELLLAARFACRCRHGAHAISRSFLSFAGAEVRRIRSNWTVLPAVVPDRIPSLCARQFGAQRPGSEG